MTMGDDGALGCAGIDEVVVCTRSTLGLSFKATAVMRERHLVRKTGSVLLHEPALHKLPFT